ncbi:MAG: serine O-acetyltransferase [Lachnospiraceae bacterium]|nr:serine O-acetyltransferase [Lachnospiraceae bacterium]
MSIKETVSKITFNYQNSDLLCLNKTMHLPNRNEVIGIIKDLRKIIFPGYFEDVRLSYSYAEYYVGNMLVDIQERLKQQVLLAIRYVEQEKMPEPAIIEKANEICRNWIEKIPYIQEMLLKDVQAGFDGDPAAKSKEEIIFCYPGFFAIYVYRLAHELYVQNVPFIPRIMTEYAHGKTGIDINSGAEIGEYFFIDHGTGVVIGETTVIGNNVKLYQGVTLGALSTRSGQQLREVKRHPTIEDNVTIYSGATILGGETIIGESAVIGGNAFITQSIPANTKVSIKNPELKMKEGNQDKMKITGELSENPDKISNESGIWEKCK